MVVLLRQRLPGPTKDKIKQILQQAIDDNDPEGKPVYSVTFGGSHSFPVPDFQLLPDNNSAPYRINNGDGSVTYPTWSLVAQTTFTFRTRPLESQTRRCRMEWSIQLSCVSAKTKPILPAGPVWALSHPAALMDLG